MGLKQLWPSCTILRNYVVFYIRRVLQLCLSPLSYWSITLPLHISLLSVFTVGQDVNRQMKNCVNIKDIYKIMKDYPGTATLVFYILISPIINSYIFSRTVAVSIPATFSISSYKLMINLASLPSPSSSST